MAARFKKEITFASVILLALMASFVGRYALDKYKHWKEDQFYAQKIATIDGYAEKDLGGNFHKVADNLHDFVRNNSQHNMDEEFYANWPDRMKLADAFIAGLEGKRRDKPHMECSTRSNILSALFQKHGYRVRNVVLYAPKQELASHRIIEALNPETKKWEAHDVTYDVFYRNKATKERASLAEVGAAIDKHEPCNTKGQCGWNLATADSQKAEKLKDYLRIIMINDDKTGLRISLHADDIDPEHIYHSKGSAPGKFCDIWSKNCKQGFLPFSQGLERTAIY